MFGTRRLRSSILALNVVALLLGVTTLGYGLYAIYAAVRMAPHNESDTPDTPGTPRTSNGVVIGLSVAAAVALAIAGLFGLCAGAMGLHAVGDVGVPSSWHSSRGLHVTSFVFSIFCIALWAALLAVYALYDAGVIVLSILTFIMEVGIYAAGRRDASRLATDHMNGLVSPLKPPTDL